MTGPAAMAPFAGFEASVRTCVALLGRSWPLLGISLVTWSAIVVCMALDVSRAFVIGASVVSSAAILLSLRSHLIGPELYLPASARTRSLAIALVGTIASLGAFSCVAVLGGFILSQDGPLIDPTPVLLGILATGAVSVSPEVLGGDHPRLGWITGVFFLGALLWQGAAEVNSSGDLARLLPLAVAGAILLFSRLPKSWLQHPAPAFLQGGIRDVAFPAGVADPILAVRALLAAERARSVGWRLVPIVVYSFSSWATRGTPHHLDPASSLALWGGLLLFAVIPVIFPVSAFGVEATPVALTLPAAPLSVHHAVIREAAIRAGMVFGVFAIWWVLSSLSISSNRFGPLPDPVHLVGSLSWLVPVFSLILGASAWVSYPSPLPVFLVKAGMIASSIPLGLGWFGRAMYKNARAEDSVGLLLDTYFQLCALLTLLSLLALLLGELRARRAFRPYRSAP